MEESNGDGSGCEIGKFLSGCSLIKKLSDNYNKFECKYFNYFGNMWKARALKNSQ
jgi:hypothetical protein